MGMCKSRNNWLKVVETLIFRKRMGTHPSISRSLTPRISIRQEVVDWRSLYYWSSSDNEWIYVVHHGRGVCPQMDMSPSRRNSLKITVTITFGRRMVTNSSTSRSTEVAVSSLSSPRTSQHRIRGQTHGRRVQHPEGVNRPWRKKVWKWQFNFKFCESDNQFIGSTPAGSCWTRSYHQVWCQDSNII